MIYDGISKMILIIWGVYYFLLGKRFEKNKSNKYIYSMGILTFSLGFIINIILNVLKFQYNTIEKIDYGLAFILIVISLKKISNIINSRKKV
jgi:low temperature requirement protein LtrA